MAIQEMVNVITFKRCALHKVQTVESGADI